MTDEEKIIELEEECAAHVQQFYEQSDEIIKLRLELERVRKTLFEERWEVQCAVYGKEWAAGRTYQQVLSRLKMIVEQHEKLSSLDRRVKWFDEAAKMAEEYWAPILEFKASEETHYRVNEIGAVEQRDAASAWSRRWKKLARSYKKQIELLLGAVGERGKTNVTSGD